MAFYAFPNKVSHWWGATENLTTTYFDSSYSVRSISTGVANGTMAFNWGVPLTDCWIHARMYIQGGFGAGHTGWLWRVLNANGEGIGELDLVTQSNVSNLIRVSDNGSTFTNGADAGAYPKNLQFDLDIHVQINSGGSNIVSVYHDGVLWSSASATFADSPGITAWHMDNNDTGAIIHVSEVMIADEDTRGLRCATLEADGVGGLTAWDGDHTDVSVKGDGQAISSDTAGQRESFTLSAYNGPASPTAVRGVFTQAIGSKGSSGPSKIDHFLRIGSTNHDDAANHSPGPSIPMISEWVNNPATSAAWDTAALASLEMGVESVA